MDLTHNALDHGNAIVGRNDQGDDQPGGIRPLAGDVVGVDVDQEPPCPGGRSDHRIGGGHKIRVIRPPDHGRVLPESGTDRDVVTLCPGIAEHPLQEQVGRQFPQYSSLFFRMHEISSSTPSPAHCNTGHSGKNHDKAGNPPR